MHETTLKTLNDVNGAHIVCEKFELQCLKDFPEGKLYAAIMGLAYGGDVERIIRNWGERGEVWGYDTFIGHPKHLAQDQNAFEATCMEHWYRTIGTDALSYEYQRKVLDSLGFTNAHLIKGEVQKDSCKDIPYLNYAFLDMDIIASMQTGYEAVKDKLVEGGYLLLHDVNNIQTLIQWYTTEVRTDPMWEILVEYDSLTAVLRKKHANR